MQVPTNPVVFQDLKQPYQGKDNVGTVVESWPWFHIMEEAMQGRLYNSNLVLSPENAGSVGYRGNGQPNQNHENTDILEFLIKTEMEDTVAAETAADDGPVHAVAPAEGIPMGWRRMSECSYKSTLPLTDAKSSDTCDIHVSLTLCLGENTEQTQTC